ncbi:bridge-like lipid transfer protein family member 3B isoform X2 [Hydra vulgaris]|uniref:Bridge-like lipid transfer protein family member 3B isoform X2 n=1 Tax=Hydra vulgaris TaxID=6087 RepID=A0ABM4BCV5_HYDVU
MASWAKNQITKQLTKFAKNLDPSSINLKFFKGEGELTNLELDERVLSELLEFPPWLQLTKVTCNKISAKVPWTSLKSDPIRLRLDCVEVQIVASETAREKVANLPVFASSNGKPSKYGFTERVLDGMYISINTVLVAFTSAGFKASVNVSRIVIQSTTPDWQQANSLRSTRLKDEVRGEVLTFKEIRWGTMKVDADASYKPESKDILSTPLRLITNNSVIRLVIKKRLIDCTMIASKLAIILDDILWVLTQSQLLKFSSFVQYLLKLRSQFLPISQGSMPNPQRTESNPTYADGQATHDNIFSAYNLTETSIHLRTHQVDLHLCDDSSLNGNQSKDSTDEYFDEAGAALQISLTNIALDHCPYHVAGTYRSAVRIDDQVAYQRKHWAQQLLTNFRETEGKRRLSRKDSMLSQGPQRQKEILYESFFVINCSDFKIMQVTTSKTMENKPFLSSEKEALYLPKEMPAIYIDHSMYYYAQNVNLPVPLANLFISLNPTQLTFHPLTCVWLNRFSQSIIAGLDWTKDLISREPGFAEHMDIRLEALMPKINIPLMEFPDLFHTNERPKSMQIQISQAIVSNCRVGDKCTQPDILNDLQSFISSRHYADMTCFPNMESDVAPLSNSTWLNDYSINYYQFHNLTKKDKSMYGRLKQQNNLPKEIWCIWFDQFWIEFIGIEKACLRPVPFVHAFPLRLWFCQNVSYVEGDEESLLPYDHSSINVKELEDVKFKTMQVVYENPHLFPELNRKVSLSNEDDYPKNSLSEFSNSSNQFKTQKATNIQHLKVQNYTGEDVRRFEALRISHSENDLLTLSNKHNTIDTLSLNEYSDDYKKDVPPPPYSSKFDEVYPLSRNKSTTSLPPEYLECDNLSSTIKALDIKYENTEVENASIGILFSSSKAIKVQLDHFQLLFLLRLGELFALVSNRVALDNLRSKSNTQKATQDCDNGTIIFNVAVPSVVLDLVLSPCNGIDPIQRLTLSDRVRYEKEKKNGLGLFAYSSSILPLKKIDELSSFSSNRKENSPVTGQNIVESQVYPECLISRNENTSKNNLLQESNSLTSCHPSSEKLNASENYNTVFYSDNPEYFQNRSDVHFGDDEYQNMVFQSRLVKEFCDVGVQVGESLNDLTSQSLNQLISVLRVRIGGVSLGLQVREDKSTIKFAAETLALNELGNLNYSQMLDSRGNLGEDRSDNKESFSMNAITGEGALKIRITSGAQVSPGEEQELGYAEIRVEALVAALLMSTLDNLAEFAEDEFIISQITFDLQITNSDISLYDDKPRRYLSVVKPPPTQIIVDELYISRDKDGILTFNHKLRKQHSGSENKNKNFENTDITHSGCQNTDINSIIIPDSINQHVDELIGENARLLDDLKVVNAKVIGLNMERESLLKVIDKLQHELIYSNKENDNLQRRVRSVIGRNKENFV